MIIDEITKDSLINLQTLIRNSLLNYFIGISDNAITTDMYLPSRVHKIYDVLCDETNPLEIKKFIDRIFYLYSNPNISTGFTYIVFFDKSENLALTSLLDHLKKRILLADYKDHLVKIWLNKIRYANKIVKGIKPNEPNKAVFVVLYGNNSIALNPHL